MTNSIAHSQTKKIGANNISKNVFQNEYWSKFTGNITSVNFEHYFFTENGTFVHTYGYSGGMYYETNCRGTYEYNPLKKKIKLLKIKCDKKEISGHINQIPSTILIKELTDTTITISTNKNGSDYIMGRLFAMTTDQYWYKGSNSSHNSIHFTEFGQATVIQETDMRREYVCSYHIIENYLFLEVRSMTTIDANNERKTKLFTPEIQTYLKINIEKDNVGLENIDLNKIIDGKRNWKFKNLEYQIENTDPNENKTEYDKYTRVTGG